MAKKNKSVFGIFIESIGLYFSNFKQFVKYMTFPVLGQVLGLILVFVPVYFYIQQIPNLVEKYSTFNDFSTIVVVSILISIPGMIILLKSFWEYLIAYGAINSMLDNMLRSGKVYDFDAHTELIKRRAIPFIGLWALVGVFAIFAVIPFLWVPAGILAVYFALIFQVFTYEPEKSPIGCAKRSFELVKGNFASTFIMLMLVGLLTYIFIPKIIVIISEKLKIMEFLSTLIVPMIPSAPVAGVNEFLAYYHVATFDINLLAMSFVSAIIAQIFIQYTLPIRSIACGIWYNKLNGGIPKPEDKLEKKSKGRKTKVKRPSEKLMEESHKKFVVKKKLDRNILRRAMEKDENYGDNYED